MLALSAVALTFQMMTPEPACWPMTQAPSRIYKPRATGEKRKLAPIRQHDAQGGVGETSIWPGIDFGTENGRPKQLRSSRKRERALRRIFGGRYKTWFCDCAFDKRGRLDRQSCGYAPQARGKVTRRIAWQPIVHPREFGVHRPCWERGGIEACMAEDSEFRAMALDMSNTMPVVAELGERRGFARMGEIADERREWGSCDFELDGTRELFEISDSRRGDMARVYLYLFHTYPGGLPLSDARLSALWRMHRDDPPSKREHTLARRIASYQGAGNPFVVHPVASNTACCKVCRVGRPCGDGCVPADRSCQEAPGCACAPNAVAGNR